MKGFRILISALAASLVVCGTSNPTKSADRSAPVAVDPLSSSVASQELADALKLIADKDWPKALSTLKAIIEANSFSARDSDFRYKVLVIAGRTALYHGPPQMAFEYLVRVTSMPQADFDDWHARLRAAEKWENKADIVSTLTLLAQRWPDRTIHFDDDYILHVIGEAKELPRGSAMPLLQSLYEAHWKLKWDIEPSEYWRDLALGLVEEGRISQAKEVAAHVMDPYVLIAMRADRRFDMVVATNRTLFDIERATDRELAAFQAAAEKAPRSLELKWRVVVVLLNRQHYEAAQAAADAALLDIRSTNYPEKLYEDLAVQQSVFLEVRAIALQRLRRWDEAIAQLSAASLLLEKDSGNVDQIIDLGDLYCEVGRPKDALSALGKLVARTNAFGAMQLERVRLDAAIQLGDSKQVAQSLNYLHSHRSDAPAAYEEALVLANQIDRAAGELIRRLLDRDERQDALLDVQTFEPTPGTPGDLELEARRRAVISRPDVQAAVRKVGRIESYPLESDWK